MSYRDILVQVDERPQAAARVQAAAALASRSQAHLTGVFLKSTFLHDFLVTGPYAYMPPNDLDALIQQHAAAVNKAAEAARETFESAAAAAGVSSEWLTVDGDIDAPLIGCARRFDLTVFPPEMTVSLGRRKITADRLGLAIGGPVLIAPDQEVAPTFGRTVLVAWKDSRESARALRDAWPVIQDADRVHVLIVAPDGESGADGLLQRHLERHGCAANIIVDHSADATVSQLIRKHVRELKADLLVMGLYGRPRLQEQVLGGVSLELLREPPVPLFVSH